MSGILKHDVAALLSRLLVLDMCQSGYDLRSGA